MPQKVFNCLALLSFYSSGIVWGAVFGLLYRIRRLEKR